MSLNLKSLKSSELHVQREGWNGAEREASSPSGSMCQGMEEERPKGVLVCSLGGRGRPGERQEHTQEGHEDHRAKLSLEEAQRLGEV